MNNTVKNIHVLRTTGQKQIEQHQHKGNILELQNKERSDKRIPDKEITDINKELEALSYSISHDLHGPLRIIRNNCEMLDRNNFTAPGTIEQKLIQQISASSERMEKLLDALLEFSRYISIKPNYSVVGMTALAGEITDELMELETDRSNISVDIEPLTDAAGDLVLLRQVWFNLISNAFKFTAHKSDRKIKIESYNSREEVVYCISDNGAGFDMHYAEKLFCAFSRLHSIEEFNGTGVGLAIVQRIIERHNGDVWAEGEVDKGARFYFSLPRIKGY